jgi:acetyl-CoA acyltransferase 1
VLLLVCLMLPIVVQVANGINIGVEPRYMGIGPIAAIPKVLQQVGLSKEDVDIWEVCI